MANSYLDNEFLQFDKYTLEDIEPAIDELLARAQTVIANVTTVNPVSWDQVVTPLTDVTEALSKVWGVVSLYHAVLDNESLRTIYANVQPKITDFWTRLGQNMDLFEQYRKLEELCRKGEVNLDVAQRKVLTNMLLEFRLSGAELTVADKERFLAVKLRQSELSRVFSQNGLDATHAFLHHVSDPAHVAGLPADALEKAAELAKANNQTGWMFSLQFPSYFPVMQYAHHRPLRETLYKAYVTRASDMGVEMAHGQPNWDNAPLMQEILQLRHEEAKLLGYENFAQLSLETKMAKDADQVIQFLEEIAKKARPYAQQDYDQVKELGAELGITNLQPWDMAYVSEQLRERLYNFSEQEVKAYFTEPTVIQGLFRVIEQLFTVKVVESPAVTWHSDVKRYAIKNVQTNEDIAFFYLDLYAREGKQSGAWMGDFQGRRLTAQGLQKPIAYLICNFGAPMAGKVATFTHDEVLTLFHEFGHGLHHMLTEINTLGVSGINGVEWDAVELPSQFMENFGWDYTVLSSMTAHYETGEPLPEELFRKMLAAKNFQSGLQTLRQLVFGLVDMRMHSEYDHRQSASELFAFAKAINDHITITPLPEYNRWLNTFSHVFAGGYAAGYYSYKWAEVLSSDAFAAFEELSTSTGASVVNSGLGMKFRQTILAVGGSRPALESFVAFRGREPSPDALLRHLGMVAAA